ncbi:DUF6241 domain-containing protein [Neobacillus sp. SM06]|uniref:DUF6241 domain-containing protein n=1 Tax=Neobacillus sp. SM06 TaxID=3422492 RepID=UPI003D2D6473
MKKTLFFSSIAIVAIAVIVTGFFLLNPNKPSSVSNTFVDKNGNQVAQLPSPAAAKPSKATANLTINEQSTEEEVIQTMHEMTHQKVKADQKWGATLLTPKTAEAVFTIVKSSHFKEKDQLLEIATRWKNGDFSQIISDHNYFWNLQGGTIGKAYGKLSKAEEETYILTNFGKEVANQLKESGKM